MCVCECVCVFTQRFETTKFLAAFLHTVLVFNELTHIKDYYCNTQLRK